MSDEHARPDWFVPAWALATLISWAALAADTAFKSKSSQCAPVIAVLSGDRIAVVLHGIGLPYLVYRLSKRSRKPALITSRLYRLMHQS